MYSGRTLFEQFDEDVQDQIKQSLGQTIGVLFQANQLLETRYGFSSSPVNPTTLRPSSSSLSGSSEISSALTLVNQSLGEVATTPQRKSTRSPFHRIRWSFRDKKQTEKLLQEYGELNGRTHEQIKLICLGSSNGLDVRHLHHLKTNDNSKQLGFDIDATLKLSIGQSDDNTQSLELSDPQWSALLAQTNTSSGSFMVLGSDTSSVLQEMRSYTPFPQQPHEVDPRTRDRVDSLARLLQQQKEQVFRIPRCIGWKFIALQKQIVFLFEIPQGVAPRPLTLLQLLGNAGLKLSLRSKFQLALGLAKCMAQLHMVRWVCNIIQSLSQNASFFHVDMTLTTTKKLRSRVGS